VVKKKCMLFFIIFAFFENIFAGNGRILLAVTMHDSAALAKFIKKDSAIVNKKFHLGGLPCTLLELVVSEGDARMVQLLLHHGANPNICLGGGLACLLRKAIMGKRVYRGFQGERKINHQQIVEFLLAYGADPNLALEDTSEGKKRNESIDFAFLYSLSSIIELLLSYGVICGDLNYSVSLSDLSDESRRRSEQLLVTSERYHEYLGFLLKKQVMPLSEIMYLILDTSADLCIKIRALAYLLKIKKSLESVKKYFRHIPFAHAFFTNRRLLCFVLQHRGLQLEDAQGKTVERALRMCMLPQAIPAVFSACRVLYKNKNLIALLKQGKRKKKKLRRKKLLRKQKQKPLIISFMKTVCKARRAGRKDFVKAFYRNYEICRNLSTKLPEEVVGHIIGFAQK